MGFLSPERNEMRDCITEIEYNDGSKKYYKITEDYPDIGGEELLDSIFKNAVAVSYVPLEILDFDEWLNSKKEKEEGENCE